MAAAITVKWNRHEITSINCSRANMSLFITKAFTVIATFRNVLSV